MAVTKGFHWPWLIGLIAAVTGVGVAAVRWLRPMGSRDRWLPGSIFWGVYIITFVFWIGIQPQAR